MLILVAGIALVIYYIITMRITPHRYPAYTADQVYAWQAEKIKNCRRYAGLFVIYIIIAVIAGLVHTYAHKQQLPILFHIFLVVEIMYLIFCVIFIIYHAQQTAQFKREHLRG